MNHEIISFDSEVPSNLDVLVGMVSKTASEEHFGWLQSISIRMPMSIACTFDALSQHSGQSRNKLIVKSLQVALDQLWENMPEDERIHLEGLRAKLMQDRMSSKDGHSGEV